jgi:ribonucleotide reductase alpha subunit
MFQLKLAEMAARCTAENQALAKRFLTDEVAPLVAAISDNTFVCDPNAREIIAKRYLSYPSERPEDWLARVAARLALVEIEHGRGSEKERYDAARALFEPLYRLMLDRRFLPAGRTLANADHYIVPNWCVFSFFPFLRS